LPPYLKKPKKKRTFFSRNFGEFPGDPPKHFRGIFFGKNTNFDQFYTNFNSVYPAAQSGFYKKHEIYRKSFRQFWNFWNSEKSFLRNPGNFPRHFPKFREFPEIPGFSRKSSIFQKFRCFSELYIYKLCNDNCIYSVVF
jgi:hypothetical protein